MRMIEWAFEQNLPTAEKLVLVYLAWNANGYGVGPMDRRQIENATGYKKRSMQRLLKSLKDHGMYRDSGFWYVIGDSTIDTDVPNLPDGKEFEETGTAASDRSISIEFIAGEVADSVGDQLNNFELRMIEQIKRALMFHVKPEPEPEPDPVVTNPLFQELIDLGKTTAQAYALSKADLAMDEEQAEEVPLAVDDVEDGYSEDPIGRRARIADILHGSEAHTHNDDRARRMWNELEIAENKHTVKGEVDAFELIYPAIVAAAKANVGKITLLEFIDPKRASMGMAPWDRELNPIDKDDPMLMGEISAMLAELGDANDPRCQVQPRTKETGDDGEVRTETLLGFHRRVSAKYREMKKLKAMGVI